MTRKTGFAPLSLRILAVLKKIPTGKVTSYGRVAALAGSPRGARQVVRLLHSLSGKEKLPWHRVVDRNGRISLPLEAGALQRKLLRNEGVRLDAAGAVDMIRFGWPPETVKVRSDLGGVKSIYYEAMP